MRVRLQLLHCFSEIGGIDTTLGLEAFLHLLRGEDSGSEFIVKQ
jgi:hypothetical protein